MPGPYGSLSNPAELDPFQQIVNVHWLPRYLALGMSVSFSIGIGEPLPNFAIIGPEFIEPFTHRYLISLNPVAGNPIISVHVGSSGHWSTAGIGEVEATGLPSVSSVSVDPWLWTVDDGFGIKGPFHQWVAAAGIDGPYVEAPSGGDFSEGLDPSVVLKGQRFLEGAPQWSPVFSNVGQWGTGATATDTSPEITDIDTRAFSLTDLSVVYKGKTWRPVASKVSGVSGYGDGSLMVLLKREEATA